MKFSSRIILILSVLAALTLACRFGPAAATPVSDTPQPQPTIPAGLTLPPTESPLNYPTETQPATPTPSASATPQPTTPPQAAINLPATITALNVRLRSGPGTLFDAIGWMKQGEPVTVLGRVRGNDWLYIKTSALPGWVSTTFVKFTQSADLNNLPLVDIGAVVVVQGKVAETNGAPVPGVEFAIFQGRDPSKLPPDTRAHSQADGSFYLYLPASSSELWRISLTAVDCKSPIMDATCRYTGAFTPRFTDITLPTTATVSFQYFR